MYLACRRLVWSKDYSQAAEISKRLDARFEPRFPYNRDLQYIHRALMMKTGRKEPKPK